MDDPRKPRTFTIWEAVNKLLWHDQEVGINLTDMPTKVCMFHIYDALSAKRGEEEASPELLRLAKEVVQLYSENTFPESHLDKTG